PADHCHFDFPGVAAGGTRNFRSTQLADGIERKRRTVFSRERTVGEIAGWTCGRQTSAAVPADRDFRVAHASRVLVSASRRNKLLVKTRRSIAACCTDKSSRSRVRARQHARRVRYPERRARRSRSTYCTHSSNAAGSPRKWARTSPAKCSEPVINTGFGFARASVSASPTVEVKE